MNILTHIIINVTNKFINKKIKDSAEINHNENKIKEDKNYTLGSSKEQGKICKIMGYINCNNKCRTFFTFLIPYFMMLILPFPNLI